MATGTRSRGPSPNRGASIEDYIEAGVNSMTQHEFRKNYHVDMSRQIELVKLVFMRYQHPDMQEMKTFLKDFGLFTVKQTDTEIWFRGYGEDQYVYYARQGPKTFLGGAFEVASFQDLEKALAIPEVKVLSKGIERMENAPGGGYIVTLADPEGFPISLVHGQAKGEAQAMPAKIIINDVCDKPRIRKFQRYKPGPAAVHKLGHYGLVVFDFEKQFNFYTQNFNLMPTNVLYLDNEDGKSTINVGMFAHIDQGEELVDHHTMFIVNLPPGHIKPHVHHCSFEIHDIDTQAMGHDWMAKKGYESVWGVGRHILGSQIFDYWWDLDGFMVEHYIDGDIVNQDTPVSFHLASNANDAAWGPDVPATFLE